MGKIKLKLCIHETSAALPNLMVTWFGTPLSLVPEEYLDSSKWEILRKSNWKGLNAIRIGSAYTKEDGYAQMEYDSKRLAADPSLNLWYIIQSPEIAGAKSCSQVIHASCQLIVNPSEYEESEVRVPMELYNDFGLGTNLAPIIDSQRSSEDLYLQLKKVETGLKVVGADNTGIFSKAYNKDLQKSKERKEKAFGRIAKPHSFRVPVSLKDKSSSENLKDAIIYDERSKSIILREGGLPLRFEGIARISKKEMSPKDKNKPVILINKETGRFQVSLPKVPDNLELSETMPTKLYQFVQGRK